METNEDTTMNLPPRSKARISNELVARQATQNADRLAYKGIALAIAAGGVSLLAAIVLFFVSLVITFDGNHPSLVGLPGFRQGLYLLALAGGIGLLTTVPMFLLHRNQKPAAREAAPN